MLRQRCCLKNEIKFVFEDIEVFDDIVATGFVENKMLFD